MKESSVKKFPISNEYLESKYTLIPISDLIIEEDPNVTVAYDFTVEDFYTFATDDGVFLQDTMMVLLPQTKESQEEIKRNVTQLLFSPATGKFKYSPAWDSIYGLYKLTEFDPKIKTFTIPNEIKFNTPDELLNLLIKDPKLRFKYYNLRWKNSNVALPLGLVYVNLILPDFYDKVVTERLRKKNLQALLDELAQIEYEKFGEVKKTVEFYYEITKAGNKFCTIFPLSFEFKSKEVIERRVLNKLKDLEKKDLITGLKTLEEVMEVVKEIVKREDPELYEAIDSGARGSWNEIQQLLVAIGYITDPLGRIIDKPIKGNFTSGLKKEEFFTIGYAARKGIIDRSINTDKPGYLLRRMVIAASPVVLGKISDCGTDGVLEIELDEKSAPYFVDRYLEDGTLLTKDNINRYVGSRIKIRSPIFCRTPKICRKCYGELYKKVNTDQIGILAAQSIGERVQQAMMKTFHSGGLASIGKVPNIFENTELVGVLEQSGAEIKLIKHDKIELILDDSKLDFSLTENSIIIKFGELDVIGLDSNVRTKTYKYIFDYSDLEIELYPDDILTEEGRKVAVFVRKKDSIGKIWFTTEDVSTRMSKVDSLFNATVKIEDYQEYFNELWKLAKSFDVRAVHLEILFSQMLRWKDDPRYPWRIKGNFGAKDYVIIGYKTIPFYESPLLALAFENVDKSLEFAVSTGEVSPYRKHLSVFEKALEGELDLEER